MKCRLCGTLRWLLVPLRRGLAARTARDCHPQRVAEPAIRFDLLISEMRL
jgi:hypothetical protein